MFNDNDKVATNGIWELKSISDDGEAAYDWLPMPHLEGELKAGYDKAMTWFHKRPKKTKPSEEGTSPTKCIVFQWEDEAKTSFIMIACCKPNGGAQVEQVKLAAKAGEPK